MKKNMQEYGAVLLLVLMITACGGLRYSHLAPEAKGFHPKTVGVLPADVGTYEEARGVIEDILVREMVGRKWFQNVVAAETINRQLKAGEAMRKILYEYVSKLKAVNFSDPELSREIGRLAQVEAFLLINVDYWQYTMENKERLAKVGIGLKMIEAETGIVMWGASHHESESYRWIRPELSKVARKLASRMVNEMPH